MYKTIVRTKLKKYRNIQMSHFITNEKWLVKKIRIIMQRLLKKESF